jgi:hypothetical protein
MPAPCTVSEFDPVTALLIPRVTLTPPESDDQTSVTLELLTPAVHVTRRVPASPCAARPITNVSEAQIVRSHPVNPNRALPVYITIPKPAPCTVAITDPVLALFTASVTLNPLTSKDQASVKLPARSPTVITDCLDPATACPTRHLTDVSDTHSVDSHPDLPARDLPVYPTVPILAPCTVIDLAPTLC